jgi:hypothetical protein
VLNNERVEFMHWDRATLVGSVFHSGANLPYQTMSKPLRKETQTLDTIEAIVTETVKDPSFVASELELPAWRRHNSIWLYVHSEFPFHNRQALFDSIAFAGR